MWMDGSPGYLYSWFDLGQVAPCPVSVCLNLGGSSLWKDWIPCRVLRTELSMLSVSGGVSDVSQGWH